MASTIETVIDGIKDYISNNIGDYLDDEERSSSDHLRLPDFVNIYVGDHELSAIDSFPALLFRYGQIDITEETTQQDLFTFNLTFWIAVSDSSYENMQRRLFRYSHCFKKIFDDDRTLGDIADESRITGISYSPVMNPGQGMQLCFIDTEIFVLVTRNV